MMKKLAISVAMLTFAAGAAMAKGGPPANAGPPDAGTPTGVACKIQTMASLGDISFGTTGASACYGWVNGNLVQDKVTTDNKVALDALGSGYTFTVNDPAVFKIPGLGGSTLATLDKIYYGKTVIGVHVGNGSPTAYPGVESSAFYLIDFGTLGSNKLDLHFDASSNLAIYATGKPPVIIPPTGGPVPEPASWALMIAGFGGVGTLMRRRRTAVA